MKSKEQKQRQGLVVLYVLLLIGACLVHQVKAYWIARLFLGLTVILIIIFWRYLLREKIISIGLFSSSVQKNLAKDERRFLYGLAFLFAPVLKLSHLSIIDVVLTLGIIILIVALSAADEKYAEKQKS